MELWLFVCEAESVIAYFLRVDVAVGKTNTHSGTQITDRHTDIVITDNAMQI